MYLSGQMTGAMRAQRTECIVEADVQWCSPVLSLSPCRIHCHPTTRCKSCYSARRRTIASGYILRYRLFLPAHLHDKTNTTACIYTSNVVQCHILIVHSKNVQSFYFCDYSAKCWPIVIIFGSIAAEKIYNQTHILFLWYSVCIWILQNRKTRERQCCRLFTQCSSCRVVLLSCRLLVAFQKFI